jgi:hypothetical protein
MDGMTTVEPPDLVRHVSLSSGLPLAISARLVTDMLDYFNETVEEFVRRRHGEMRSRSFKNAEIWVAVTAELGQQRFAAPRLSERQLRRIIYG